LNTAREKHIPFQRDGLVSLMTGTPLPFQPSSLSSPRAKQPGGRSTGTAGRNVSVGSFFLGFRVKMQPQTTIAIIAATKIPSCTCCIVVFSVAMTPPRAHYMTVRASSLSQKVGRWLRSVALHRA
jgi:hypothetical protein